MWVGLAIGAALLLGGVATGLWMVWQRWLQFCPHCAWVVRRVHHGWLRCSRCHKQYGRHAKLRPH